MVYFIGNKEHKFLKIGFSKNINKRIKQINSSCPYDIEVLLELEGYYLLEQYLHNLFKKYHLKLEWFELSDEIQEFINNPKYPSFNDSSKRSSYKIDELIDLYRIGKSNIEISNILNISIHTVRRRVKDLGLRAKYKIYRYSKPKGYYIGKYAERKNNP